MKRLIIISLLFITFTGKSFSQTPITGMYPADRFMFDIFTDIWQNLPDNMSTNTINRGINIAMYQDFPIGSSSFSFGAGLGFTGHNLYSDNYYMENLLEGDFFTFFPIDETGGDIRKNKLSLNYLNIPLELRFRSRTVPHVFRVSAGLRAGVLVNAHTKHHFRNDGDAFPEDIKFKQQKLENIQTFQFGITGRVGYRRINLYGYFPLNDIFEGNGLEEMRPISVGLSFILY